MRFLGIEKADQLVDHRGRTIKRTWPAEAPARREILKAFRRSTAPLVYGTALIVAVIQLALSALGIFLALRLKLSRETVQVVFGVLFGALYLGMAVFLMRRLAPRSRAFLVEHALARGLCPTCLSELARSGAAAADGCTPCVKCGGAWKVPALPPAPTARG